MLLNHIDSPFLKTDEKCTKSVISKRRKMLACSSGCEVTHPHKALVFYLTGNQEIFSTGMASVFFVAYN